MSITLSLSLHQIKMADDKNKAELRAHIRTLSNEPRSLTHSFYFNNAIQEKKALEFATKFNTPLGKDLGDNITEVVSTNMTDGNQGYSFHFDFQNGKGIFALDAMGYHLEELGIPDGIVLMQILQSLDTEKANSE
jgi:hypothetical protein